MNNKTKYSLIAALVVAVLAFAYLFGPSELFQGNIGKSANIPPWCVKPGSVAVDEEPPPYTPPFLSEEQKELLKWGSNTPGTPSRSFQPEVPTGTEGIARIPGGYEIPGTTGTSSGIEIDPEPKVERSGGIAVNPEPNFWDNPWSWLTGDKDGGDRGYGGGEETPKPVTPEKDPGTKRGRGSTRGGGTGRTSTPGGLPDVEVKGEFEGWFDCGCDDKDITFDELGLTFACPEKNGDSKNYNDPGKYNINIYKPTNLDCSCPKGYYVDGEKHDNLCDYEVVNYKSICLNQKTSKKILDMCGDADWESPKDYKEKLAGAHENFAEGYLKCWTPSQCKQFAADLKSGKISDEYGKKNYDEKIWSKKNICIKMGYTKWDDWSPNP